MLVNMSALWVISHVALHCELWHSCCVIRYTLDFLSFAVTQGVGAVIGYDKQRACLMQYSSCACYHRTWSQCVSEPLCSQLSVLCMLCSWRVAPAKLMCACCAFCHAVGQSILFDVQMNNSRCKCNSRWAVQLPTFEGSSACEHSSCTVQSDTLCRYIPGQDV